MTSLLSKGYNTRYGARSIKNEVERKIVNEVARAHEMDAIGEGAKMRFVVENGQVRMRVVDKGGDVKVGEQSAGGLLGKLWGGRS